MTPIKILMSILVFALVLQNASGDMILLDDALRVPDALRDPASTPEVTSHAQEHPNFQVLMLNARSAMVYDEQEHRSLYSKNAERVVPIASITKLMTAMVVLDAHLPMDKEIRIRKNDMDMLKKTHSRMRPGMKLTRGELLKLALMSSENRAAAALARTYPGGTQAAVAKMNAKARELGMHSTHFIDPTGLNSGNVSTANDLIRMVIAAQDYEAIHRATTSSSHFVKLAGYRPILYRNTNPLVGATSWSIDVSKTGFINEAGRCLVMKVNIKQRPVVIVLLDSESKDTRIGDAIRIKEWMENV